MAPEGETMTSAEFDCRGGLKAEPRTERSRRVIEEFWAFTESGAEVPKRVLESEHFEQTDDTNGFVWVIDTNPSNLSLAGALPDISVGDSIDGRERADYTRKRVAVVRMRRVDVVHDEYRSAWAPTPLRAEVGFLPTVLPVSDPRRPRTQITTRHVERVEPAVETVEAAE
jgi:hypothetical protein